MSSPVLLSISTVLSLMGIVLVALAFGTDFWQVYKVDRHAIEATDPSNAMVENVYYSRNYGLFRECFEGDAGAPANADLKAGVLGGLCQGRGHEYQIAENDNAIEKMSGDEKTKYHLMRVVVAFYITGLVFLLLCLFTGVAGCWMRSACLIITTGVFLLFSTLFLVAAMAVWHGVNYLSMDRIKDSEIMLYRQSWPDVLKENTTVSYGWSYMISWIGIGLIFIASVLMLAAYRVMKIEDGDDEDMKRPPYMMAPYGMADQGTLMKQQQQQQAMMPYGAAAYGTYGYANTYAPASAAAYYGGNYGYGTASPYGYLTYGR